MSCSSSARFRAMLTCIAVMAMLFIPGSLQAGEDTPSAPSAKGLELMAQAPRTPEELLQRIVEWTRDPHQDAYEYIERLSGCPRETWSVSKWINEKSTRLDPPVRTEYGATACYEKWGMAKPYPHGIGVDITHTGQVWSAGIPIWKDIQKSCINPAMAIQFFGKPDSIYINRMPYCNTNADYTLLVYRYQPKPYQYHVEFRFKLVAADYLKGKLKCDGGRRRDKVLKPDYVHSSTICAQGLGFGTLVHRRVRIK